MNALVGKAAGPAVGAPVFATAITGGARNGTLCKGAQAGRLARMGVNGSVEAFAMFACVMVGLAVFTGIALPRDQPSPQQPPLAAEQQVELAAPAPVAPICAATEAGGGDCVLLGNTGKA